MNVLIVGYGFVGAATNYLFKDFPIKVTIHDPDKGYEYHGQDSFDYIFLCVPTNLNPRTKKLDISLLKTVYNTWQDYGQIVIRSTIGPDQVDLFSDAILMPEFLRENHWQEDVDDYNLPIIVSDKKLQLKLYELMLYKKKIICVKAKEAMMFKLARNSALAMQVALANHFKEICNGWGVDYSSVQKLLESDSVLGNTHWQVPGPDGKLGFGGKFLPKDLTHMSKLCYTANNIMQLALYENMVRRVADGISEPTY